MEKKKEPTHEVTQILFPLCKRKVWKQTIIGSAFSLFILLSVFINYIYPNVKQINDEKQILTSLLAFYFLILFLPLINFLYFLNYFKQYYYNFKKDYIDIKDGFMLKETKIPYLDIQDIYVNQDFLDKFLNLYDIHFVMDKSKSLISHNPHIDGLEKQVVDNMIPFVLKSESYSMRHRKENKSTS